MQVSSLTRIGTDEESNEKKKQSDSNQQQVSDEVRWKSFRSFLSSKMFFPSVKRFGTEFERNHREYRQTARVVPKSNVSIVRQIDLPSRFPRRRSPKLCGGNVNAKWKSNSFKKLICKTCDFSFFLNSRISAVVFRRWITLEIRFSIRFPPSKFTISNRISRLERRNRKWRQRFSILWSSTRRANALKSITSFHFDWEWIVSS